MDFVNYTEAAKIAGVTRQAIYDLKKANLDKVRNYPFFIYDPDSGKAGINIDNIEWKRYLDRGNKNHRQKNNTVKNTQQLDTNPVQDNNVFVVNLVNALQNAVIKIFSPSDKKMDELKQMIKSELRNING